MDPGREMQLRRVLHERGAQYIGRFGELKYLLAPYVATNAAEQRRFYQLWDEYVADLEQRTNAAPTNRATGEEGPPPLWKNVLWGLLAVALVLAVGAVVYLGLQASLEPPPPRISVDVAQEADVRAGQPLPVFNRTLLEERRDSLGFHWEIADANSAEPLYELDAFDHNYVVPEDFTGRSLRILLRNDSLAGGPGVDSLVLAVLCGLAPQLPFFELPVSPVVQGDIWQLPVQNPPAPTGKKAQTAVPDTIVYRWIINGDTLARTQVQYEFLTEGQTRVQLLAHRRNDPEFCFTLSLPRTIQVGNNLPVLPRIPLQRDTARQILAISGWLYWLPLLLGLLGYWLHRRRWRRKDEENREKTDDELAAEYPFHDVGPYVIPYRDQSGQISVPADFYRIADQLRIREASQRMAFDGTATVEATVREGGFPSWRERAVKRPSSYLVLLRHTDEFQQQDRLLKRLTDFLAAREAALEVYYHAGDFDWFWNEAHPKGWSPGQLRGRYGEHRLVLLGDGHGLVDAFQRGEPRLHPAKERWLLGWSRRLLLTTEPAADWSYQEILLHTHVLLFPITTPGILRAVAQLNEVEEYQPGNYPRWQAEQLRLNPEPSHRYRTWTTVADHRAYLADDPELFRWLTALAVVPHPDWSLTIAIGRALGLEVTHDRLLRLSRIPWLAANAPDQDLRMAFLAELSVADEHLARAAALEQLEAVSGEVANTFAESEWTASQAVQSFALAPLDQKNQQQIRELLRIGLLSPDQQYELDAVASRHVAKPVQEPEFEGSFMSKVGSKFQEPVTPIGDGAYLEELLKEAPELKPVLSRKELELLGLIVGCLLLLLPMYLFNRAAKELPTDEQPAWWQTVENPTDDDHRALEANNRAVLLADYLEAGENYREYNERYLQADQKILQGLDTALTLKPAYPLADSNRTAYYLNNLAYTLNWLIQDSLLMQPQVLNQMDQRLADLRGYVDSLYGMTSPYALQARHMDGLYSWYRYRQGSTGDVELSPVANDRLSNARYIATSIDSLDINYFTQLGEAMPVHLKYLLAREPQPLVDFIDRVYTGRVVDQTGAPLNGVDIVVAGTQRGFVTANGGNYRIAPQLSEGKLLFSYRNGPVRESSLLEADGSPLKNTELRDVMLNRPFDNIPFDTQLTTQEDGPEQTPDTPATDASDTQLEQLIDRFSNYRYSRTFQQTGTADRSAAFASQLVAGLRQQPLRNPVVTGNDLVKGATVATNGRNHDVRNGTFLFVRPRLSPGPLGDKVDRLHRDSRAIIVESTDFAKRDPPLPDLAAVGRATETLAKELEANGFNVVRLKNPSRYELTQSLASYANADFPPTAQLVVYLSGYHDGDQLYVQGGSIPNEELEATLRKLDEVVPHLLVIKNYTEVPEAAGAAQPIMPDMVQVPGGTFEMGDTFGEGEVDEKPVHKVTVSSYAMGRYEVTFAEYDRFTEATGKALAEADFGRGRQPAINVSWFDAISYCNWLSKLAGYRPVYALADQKKQSEWAAKDYGLELADDDAIVIDWSANGYRLPTEAEWEFAASYVDGKGKARFGNGRDKLWVAEANFDAGVGGKKAYSEVGSYREKTVAVGSLNSPNALGIHYLAGNVWEWCADWYGENYYNQSKGSRNPNGPGSGSNRVLRGGSWIDYPVNCRAAKRIGSWPGRRTGSVGFRLVRSPRE